ncbi:MAG: hypothetical protein ACX93T_02960 [Bacteroidota bacterium]
MKCYNCYNSQLDSSKEACGHCGARTNPPAVKYFYVHPLLFVLLTLVTLGLFYMYWIYKNWVAIKLAENTKIRPFWRTLFAAYFYFSLFARIYGDAKANGYKSRLSASWLVVFSSLSSYFMGVVFFAFVSGASPMFIFLSIMWVIASLPIILLPMLLIQPAIKFCNTQIRAAEAKR